MSTQSITRTHVQFNRSARRWQAVNGQVKVFPAGPEGKRAALLTALEHDRPELFAIVAEIAAMHDDNPQFVDRLLKAAQLLARGHVYAAGRVKSQKSGQVYNVTYSGVPRAYRCGCEDFERGLMRQAGESKWGGVDSDYYGLMCKHTLAQLLAWLAGVELASEPIPFDGRAFALPASVDVRGTLDDWLG